MPADAATYAAEDLRMMQLERARAQAAMREGSSRKNLSSIYRQVPAHVNLVELILIGGFAGISDLLDYLIVGSIPIIGDILDLVTWFVIFMWIFLRGLKPMMSIAAGAVEFIPFIGDLPPTWIGIVIVVSIYSYISYKEYLFKNRRKIKRAKKDVQKTAAQTQRIVGAT